MTRPISGATRLAGVVGHPIRHSLSPILHNAWIEAAGLDAAYVPFAIAPERFRAFVDGLRGGSVVGLNITIPFKEEALALADAADGLARRAGAANLLVFGPDGRIQAKNTDGIGLLEALYEQAPGLELSATPVLVIGAGGAARAAAAALLGAGASELRLLNRTPERAEALARDLDGVPKVYAWEDMPSAVAAAGVIVNATSLGLEGRGVIDVPLETAPTDAVVMDMVYRPLMTGLLRRAKASGRRAVDGLAMLIGQARPTFEALFGIAPPADVDVRRLALEALGESG